MLACALHRSHAGLLTVRSCDDEAHATHVERVARGGRFHLVRWSYCMLCQPGGSSNRIARSQRSAVNAIALMLRRRDIILRAERDE